MTFNKNRKSCISIIYGNIVVTTNKPKAKKKSYDEINIDH